MNFRRHRRREDLGVDITPLIDVVFLLLIFFMVSTTFIRETQLRIDLPEATGAPAEQVPDAIEITVDAGGDYSVNDRLLLRSDLETLLRALAEALEGRDPGDRRVIITADGKASHQAVVRAMDAAGKVGLSRISITTRQPEEEE
jgi:biopolymer transport protein ExbD